MPGTHSPDRVAPAVEPAGQRRTARARWLAAIALGGCALALLIVFWPAGGHSTVRRELLAQSSSPAVSVLPSLQAPVPAKAASSAPGIPVSVSVPSVGISSSLQGLGLLPDHSLQPPTLYQRAGWYAGGIRPGATGPAIIAGHVDSYAGPAVFFRLKEVKLGADIDVRDSAGTVRHFTVTDIRRYAKSAFPTDAVYGPSSLPVLRLITCTGDFDASKRSYLDNLVVSAELDAPRAG